MPASPPIPAGADFLVSGTEGFSGDLYVDPSASIVITLPDAVEGLDYTIWHVGAGNTLTVDLPGGTDLKVLSAGQSCRVRTYTDSAGVPQYETYGLYTVTNGSVDRTFDANATSIDELADVLATLIADLKVKGVIG